MLPWEQGNEAVRYLQILLEQSICGKANLLMRRTEGRDEIHFSHCFSARPPGSGVRDGLGEFYGQATKGVRWMPWRQKATKDVASCDKPRGAASRL